MGNLSVHFSSDEFDEAPSTKMINTLEELRFASGDKPITIKSGNGNTANIIIEGLTDLEMFALAECVAGDDPSIGIGLDTYSIHIDVAADADRTRPRARWIHSQGCDTYMKRCEPRTNAARFRVFLQTRYFLDRCREKREACSNG